MLNSPLSSSGFGSVMSRTSPGTAHDPNSPSPEDPTLTLRFKSARAAMTRPQRLSVLVFAWILLHRVVVAQGLTGALVGSVGDGQGGLLVGAIVRLTW